MEFPFDKVVRLQSTTNYRSKNSNTDTFFGSAQKSKDVLKFKKISIKSFANQSLFL